MHDAIPGAKGVSVLNEVFSEAESVRVVSESHLVFFKMHGEPSTSLPQGVYPTDFLTRAKLYNSARNRCHLQLQRYIVNVSAVTQS